MDRLKRAFHDLPPPQEAAGWPVPPLKTEASEAGIAFIEVAGAAEEQPIAIQAGIAIRWLHRNGAAAGMTTLLADAVRETAFPEDHTPIFARVACELEGFKAIRSHLHKGQGLKKS